MGRPGPQTFAKRQREQAKRDKRRAKQERKAARKAAKESDTPDTETRGADATGPAVVSRAELSEGRAASNE